MIERWSFGCRARNQRRRNNTARTAQQARKTPLPKTNCVRNSGAVMKKEKTPATNPVATAAIIAAVFELQVTDTVTGELSSFTKSGYFLFQQLSRNPF